MRTGDELSAAKLFDYTDLIFKSTSSRPAAGWWQVVNWPAVWPYPFNFQEYKKPASYRLLTSCQPDCWLIKPAVWSSDLYFNSEECSRPYSCKLVAAGQASIFKWQLVTFNIFLACCRVISLHRIDSYHDFMHVHCTYTGYGQTTSIFTCIAVHCTLLLVYSKLQV